METLLPLAEYADTESDNLSSSNRPGTKTGDADTLIERGVGWISCGLAPGRVTNVQPAVPFLRSEL
jgi:hypothetical protein